MAFRSQGVAMKILLYQDDTLDFDLSTISVFLSSRCESLSVAPGMCKFAVPSVPIQSFNLHSRLPTELVDEAETADLAICGTAHPYENNYFFESFQNVAIVSFYAWDNLTSLPRTNGLVFFLAAVLGRTLALGQSHDRNTGCINDFWWDKTGIDKTMRTGIVCPDCRETFWQSKPSNRDRSAIADLTAILNDLSAASSRDKGILDYWESKGGLDFDVFLCHNSSDKEAVRSIARRLQVGGIRPWLDDEQLQPGRSWQVMLEEQIARIRSAAVFVGDSGIGPWQRFEIRAFLTEFVNRQCPVIPVILQGTQTVPELPIFLRQLQWVDFRKGYAEGLKALSWGITGRRNT